MMGFLWTTFCFMAHPNKQYLFTSIKELENKLFGALTHVRVPFIRVRTDVQVDIVQVGHICG